LKFSPLSAKNKAPFSRLLVSVEIPVEELKS